MGTSVYDEHAVFAGKATYTIADGTTTKAVASPTINARVDALVVSSNAAADHVLTLWLSGSPAMPIGTINIPAGAGTVVATPAVDALTCLPSTSPAVMLLAGQPLGISLAVALGAGETIYAYYIGGTF